MKQNKISKFDKN